MFILTVVSLFVGIGLIWQTSRENNAAEKRHAGERQSDREQIAGLNRSVETQTQNNETQYVRSRDEIHRLQDQLTDLKKDITTTELRRKLGALEGQLEKALTPAPKARLRTSFWMAGIMNEPISEIYVPVDENVVTVELLLLNQSDVNAKNGGFWLRICDACKYHKEPVGFQHPLGALEVERLLQFVDLPSGSASQKLTVEIEIPSDAHGKMVILTKYRCENCEIEKDWQQLWVTLGRISWHKS